LLRRYARRLASRPPSAGRLIVEPGRTIEVACFMPFSLALIRRSPPLFKWVLGNIDPVIGQISREGHVIRLQPRTMGTLLCLARHAGEVVSIDDLLTEVWPGLIVTPDSVYQAVASLRQALGDDPKNPAYIVTVPRLG
jgi:DNA-binding response OmpR family regulator